MGRYVGCGTGSLTFEIADRRIAVSIDALDYEFRMRGGGKLVAALFGHFFGGFALIVD